MPKYYTVTLTLPDGTRKYYRGKTKREATEKRDKARSLLGQGLDVQDESTFLDFSQVWFDTYKRGKLHVRSEETIRDVLNRYVIPQLGSLKLKQIKPLHIQHLVNSVNKYSLSTQKKVIQYTRAIFEAALENGLVLTNPVVKSIKPTADAPDEVEPLTDEQVSELLDSTKGTRVYPFLVVLRYCGLRRSEALGLMWSDVDFESGTLFVRRSLVYPESNKRGEIETRMKTKHAKRAIPLSPDVAKVLWDEKTRSASLYVFSMGDGNFLSESSYRRMWEIVGRRNLDFHVHPHQLRHTCITAWIEQGLGIEQVQYLAGHASPEITLRVYTHYREAQRREDTAEQVRAIRFAT